jgi:hypothetical protein
MQGEETPTWLATILPTPLDVNWQREGDERIHPSVDCLGEEVSLEGNSMGTRKHPQSFRSLTLCSCPLRPSCSPDSAWYESVAQARELAFEEKSLLLTDVIGGR